MMRVFLILIAALSLYMPRAYADGELLSVDLAEDHVDITTGFNGALLNLFGVQDEPGDIAITISGPARKTIVRQKSKIFGVWMNRNAMIFKDVPVYYNFAVSRDVDKIAPDALLNANRIGLGAMRFTPKGKEDGEQIKAFQDAMIRNKQAQKLFPDDAAHIKFIDDHFFRTSFYIPSNAPVGNYTIKTFLIRDGEIRDTKVTDLKVAQVGTSATIFDFAQDWSFAYGLLCVLFAMSAGWLSSVVRQRLR